MLQASLLHFSIFFLSAKNGKSQCKLKRVFGYSASTINRTTNQY